MQRYLLVMRHAHAEDTQPERHDRERELTSKGNQEALLMGSQLAQRSLAINALYTSSAVRTKQTGSLISDVLKLERVSVLIQEDLYNSSIRTYLSFINNLPDDLKTVLMIGHNPAVSYLAEYLTNADLGSMPTAGICLIRFELNAWQDVSKGCGEMLEFLYPERFHR
jgi:phosphohistidine phosphatase